MNINFSDFDGRKANKENVGRYLEKQNPELVIFNGHGTETSIHGHKDESLIESNENEGLLESKITYAIACNAAANLGRAVVEKGGISFIGYGGPFSFVRDASRECNPSVDKFAEPFKRMSNEIILSLLRGKNTGEAYDKSQD